MTTNSLQCDCEVPSRGVEDVQGTIERESQTILNGGNTMKTMNTEIAGETIAANISLRTYEKLFHQMDESKNPLARAKTLVAHHFESLLNHRFNHDKSDIYNQFIKESIIFGVISEQVKTEDERENLLSELSSLYCDSFMYGYIAGMKDSESFFEDIKGSTEENKKPCQCVNTDREADPQNRK